MNAEIRPVRTQAEQALIAMFDKASPTLAGGAGVKKLRETAAKAFAESGLPHRRIEEWKYTDLRVLMREAAPLASRPDVRAVDAAKKLDALKDVETRRITFVNGFFVPEQSDVAKLEAGLSIVSLAKALSEGTKLPKRIGELQPETYDAALALNTAFLNEGVVIDIAKDAKIDKPIHIVHLFSGDVAAAYSRSMIVVGANAKATVIESFSGVDGVGYQRNYASELHIGQGTHFDYVRLQAEGNAATHLSTLLATVGADATFSIYPFTTGAAVSRFSVSLQFAGTGTRGIFAGSNLLRSHQHADTTLVLDHAKPNCSSKELIKTVLDNESRGIFQGRIVVKPDAQKTDARMATHALMLSENAESDNKPELEIFADDVQCGHGATSGALDENLLFYFLARGIPRKEAEALLIQSFAAESIEMIPHENLRHALLKRVANWLELRA